MLMDNLEIKNMYTQEIIMGCKANDEMEMSLSKSFKEASLI